MNISEEIKQRLEIATIISESVQLEKSGQNLRGLCPFHTEKTPSFFVFPDRQTWKCFGCGAGGDVISFVMKKEGVEFGEALKGLAQRAGIDLPERKSVAAGESRIEVFYQINEAAAQYFQKQLQQSPAAGTARQYIADRGLTAETVEQFRLGFSLDSWDGLRQYLKNIGYIEAAMVTAGVIIQKEDRIYDRFRGRLMFPICETHGKVIGFGARALNDQMPKYLNSSQSPVFDKSAVLYGIDHARPAIRQQGKIVIVEGYMDVLTAHQHGFQNVVASMGTSLTEKQLSLLKGLTSHICLSLDADAAGNAATLRGIEVCRTALSGETSGARGWLGNSTELRADINIISLPEGKDPDDVIRESPDNWQHLVDHAQPLMDFQFAAIASGFSLSRAEDRLQLSERLLPLISEMRDSAMREVYLTKLSKLTGISGRNLAAKLADRSSNKGKFKAKPKTRQGFRYTEKTGDQLEETCLHILLNYPAVRELAADLDPGDFEHTENREIFALWQEAPTDGNIPEKIGPELHEHFQVIVDKQMPPLDLREQEKALQDCLRKIKQRSLKSQYVFVGESAINDGADPKESSALLIELQRRHTDLS